MIQLVTFSDTSMSNSARLCIQSAAEHGVDLPRWIQHEEFKKTDFYTEHRQLLSQPRGLGYWAWKPWVILHAMEDAKDGDVIIYSDAGVEFINDVNEVISRMDQDVHLFANQWQHAHWCKRDVIDAVWPWNRIERCASLSLLPVEERVKYDLDSVQWAYFSNQVQASVIFFRVSDYARQFVNEWLKWCLHRVRFSEGVCTDGWRYLIDDSPSIAPNHPEFREHRHDQAILTTLAYREGIKLHWWPARYNDGAFDYPRGEFTDAYPVMFHHHRRRNEVAQCA